MKASCNTCKFNFDVQEGNVCVSKFYGKQISEIDNSNFDCDNWAMSFEYYRKCVDSLPVDLHGQVLYGKMSLNSALRNMKKL